MEIFELAEKPKLLEQAVQYFWKKWGSEDNFVFYQDCILNSLDAKNKLPKFYIGIVENEIVGSYALLINDIISRQDLFPWFACLYVEEAFRKNGLAAQLLDHGLHQAKKKGFEKLYLSTDLINFYEKKGWDQFGVGFGVGGDEFKIYTKSTLT